MYAARATRPGKLAVSHVRVVAPRDGRTLVEVTLETGRKHQVRVHLADAGHPIVGDRRYGSTTRGVAGFALHAARLVFRHPRTGAAMEFRAPAPAWAKR